MSNALLDKLAAYKIKYPEEFETVARFVSLITIHPNCFERDCWAGHITGSAWLVDAKANKILLTHHKKLERWLQLGGHSDGDANTLNVALREAWEESGLNVVPYEDARLKAGELFDVDVHEIPARREDPAHFHFDIRFVLQVQGSENYTVSDESHDLAWVATDELESYTREESIMRMHKKWLQLKKRAPEAPLNI